MIRIKLDYTTCVPGIVVRYPDKLHAITVDMKKKRKKTNELPKPKAVTHFTNVNSHLRTSTFSQ